MFCPLCQSEKVFSMNKYSVIDVYECDNCKCVFKILYKEDDHQDT